MQFLNCDSRRFKVEQLTSSQTGVMFVKKEGASRFLTLLNVEIRRTAESAETYGGCQADLVESSDRGVFFTFLLYTICYYYSILLCNYKQNNIFSVHIINLQ